MKKGFSLYNLNLETQFRIAFLSVPLALLVLVNIVGGLTPINNENIVKESISKQISSSIHEKIDANIDERIGDIKSFTTNSLMGLCAAKKTYSPFLEQQMNYFTQNYPAYDLFLAVDINGKIIGVNNKDKNDKKINTEFVQKINFKDSVWFKESIKLNKIWTSNYTESGLLAKINKSKSGRCIILSSPIYDETHELVGVWCQFISWDRLVMGTLDYFKKSLQNTYPELEIFVLNQNNKTIGCTDRNIKIENKFIGDYYEHLHNENLVGEVKPIAKKLHLGLSWYYTTIIPKTKVKLGTFFTPNLLIIDFVVIISSLILASILSKGFSNRIYKIKNNIEKISIGDLSYQQEPIFGEDELTEISKSVQILHQNLTNATNFAQEIGNANFKAHFEPLSKNDDLGNAFNKMKVNLIMIDNKLRIALKKEEHSSMVKSQFLSNVSHELRTPLNAILGMTNLLISENPREDQLENLTIIRFSAHNLSNIVDDILDFNKIDSGTLHLEETPFNIKSIIKNLYLNYIGKAKEKKTSLNINFDNTPDNLMIIGDPARINQILNNLINNAIKFTENGTVSITLSMLELQNNEVTLKFAIKDTGIGIEKETLSEIFNHFSQASAGSKRTHGGIGMGLTITKSILQLYNSNIEIESEKGNGTCFSFIIKFKYAATKEKLLNNEEEIDFSLLENKNILIVDDNRINLTVATKTLQKVKCNTLSAENGKEALEVFHSNDIDLILMDLQMPIMDGYEASAAIRQTDKLIPIIALTGEAVFDVEQRIKDAGINCYISKPFKPNVLFQTMNDLLEANLNKHL